MWKYRRPTHLLLHADCGSPLEETLAPELGVDVLLVEHEEVPHEARERCDRDLVRVILARRRRLPARAEATTSRSERCAGDLAKAGHRAQRRDVDRHGVRPKEVRHCVAADLQGMVKERERRGERDGERRLTGRRTRKSRRERDAPSTWSGCTSHQRCPRPTRPRQPTSASVRSQSSRT